MAEKDQQGDAKKSPEEPSFIKRALNKIGAGPLVSLFDRGVAAYNKPKEDTAPPKMSAWERTKQVFGIALDIGRAVVSTAVGAAAKVLDVVGAGALGDQLAKAANYMDPSTDKESNPNLTKGQKAWNATKEGTNFAVNVGRGALSSASNMVGNFLNLLSKGSGDMFKEFAKFVRPASEPTKQEEAMPAKAQEKKEPAQPPVVKKAEPKPERQKKQADAPASSDERAAAKDRKRGWQGPASVEMTQLSSNETQHTRASPPLSPLKGNDDVERQDQSENKP